MNHWEAALKSAGDKGADRERLQQEHILGLIRMGAQDIPESYWKNPERAGLRVYDAVEASVRGHLARNEPDKAEQILEFWSAARPQDADVAYLQGVYWFNRGDDARALEEFENAVARQPRHELAHTAVARLLETQDRLAEALAAYVRFASACPHSDTAVVELAGVLRKLGHIEEARAVAESLSSSSDSSSELWVELASIDLELGNYREAIRRLAQVPAATGPKKQELQRDVALALALQQDTAVANRLFEQADAEEAVLLRISELLTIAPGRSEAGAELQRLSEAAASAAEQPALSELRRAGIPRRDSANFAPADLYALYCASCHGDHGGGDGRAARHQFPLPRDFRTGGFRLVSTDNGNPTLEDLKKVLQRGMPGTSMRPFDDLDEDRLHSLAEEVLRLRREGVRQRYVALLRAEGEEIDEQDVRAVVAVATLPGATIQVPALGPADPAAVARGREVYLQSGCRSCHGDDGTGTSEIALIDRHGLPVLPRNLVRDPFKGGHEPEAISLRILAGMPGSPMPSSIHALTERQCIDLVHYCDSLSRQPKRALTNHQRFLEATQRPLPAGTRVTTADADGAAAGGP
jgi:tetratricopeptide (TPR) repeat protein